MILDLGNDRELKLPDDMDEGAARLLGRFIKQLESDAAEARDRALSLEAQFASLKNEVREAPAPKDDSAVLSAINTLRVDLTAALRLLAKLQSADRVIVYDSVGTPRSRIAND